MNYESLPPELSGVEDEDFTDAQMSGEEAVEAPPDAEHAEWLMRRLVRAQQNVIDATLQRDAWFAPIKEWYERTTAADRRRILLLSDQLERFGLAVRERSGGKVKTIYLPSGEIATTFRRARIEIEDSKAVVVWAKDALSPESFAELCPPQNPLISVLRDHVNIAPVAEGDEVIEYVVVDHDGQIVSGVRVEPESVNATAKARHAE